MVVVSVVVPSLETEVVLVLKEKNFVFNNIKNKFTKMLRSCIFPFCFVASICCGCGAVLTINKYKMTHYIYCSLLIFAFTYLLGESDFRVEYALQQRGRLFR